ncbi:MULTISPECIES: transcription elongation factor GreB [unclassified Acinetobacter]|uniref:transcription elongation factor GreB n=1 Tax=unclassified Acinetobacter TaxID=196816 RepID=UPI0035B95ACC
MNSSKRKLLTSDGYDRLQQELKHLVSVERPEITKIVSWAASLGDRSENADYIYNKRRLREIDRRIRYLMKLFENAERVTYHAEQAGKVFFGAWVSLENLEATQQVRLRIVGTDEIYDQKDVVSIDAPFARACLGKRVDDEVVVITPEGKKVWYIIDIEYNL